MLRIDTSSVTNNELPMDPFVGNLLLVYPILFTENALSFKNVKNFPKQTTFIHIFFWRRESHDLLRNLNNQHGRWGTETIHVQQLLLSINNMNSLNIYHQQIDKVMLDNQ